MRNTLIGFAVVLALGIVAVYVITEEEENRRKLPILSPNEVNPALVDSSLQNKGSEHYISGFNLINQDGKPVDESIIKDKIVVADFFFTSCPSVCPKMGTQMKRIYDHFKGNDKVILLSHTVWPERDSVPVLKDYSLQYDAEPEQWLFLTGDKPHLYDLARKSYLVAPSLKDTNFTHGSENDFIHTENFVLVDNQKRIRGYYDGTDSTEVNELILDIEELLSRISK